MQHTRAIPLSVPALLIGAFALGAPLQAQPEVVIETSPTALKAPDEAVAAPSTEGIPGKEAAALTFSITPSATYTFAADLRGDVDGEASVARAGLDLNVGYRLNDTWQLTLGVSPEMSWYDLDDELIGDDDLTTLSVGVSPGVNVRLAERWSLRVAGLLSDSRELGASGSGFTYGGLVAARYQWSKSFASTFGIIASSRLDDDVFVFPLLGMEWAINDRVRLSSQGLGLELAVDVCETLTVRLNGAYEPREFRLDRREGQSDRVLRDRRVPVGVGLTWKPCASFEAALNGGAVVWQEYVLDDDDGDEIRSARTRPTGFVGVGVTFKF